MVDWTLLKPVHLFSGLNEPDVKKIAAICEPQRYGRGELIVEQNTTGTEMYVIADGSVEVFIRGLGRGAGDERVLVVLGSGQVFGEMALLDQGYRSASVRSTREGCTLYVLTQEQFMDLVRSDAAIGYTVMRNLAGDIAFKLRHRNLVLM